MKVSEPQLTVEKSRQGLGYVNAQGADLTPIARGVGSFADSLAKVAAEQKAKADQMQRFKAMSSLVDYNTQVDLEQSEFRKTAAPDDPAFAMKAVDLYVNREAEFIKTLPPDLQEEFKARVADTRSRVTINAHDFQDKQLTTFYTNEVNKRGELAASKVSEDPDSVETWKADLTQLILNSDMSQTDKVTLNQKVYEYVETAAYRAKTRKTRLEDAQYSNELVTGVRQLSDEFGVDPVDWLTLMSYETGGTFSTGTRGGAGNRHIGVIQFGPQEQKDFGAVQGQPVGEQLNAVAKYLRARGFKKGMSLAQLYATVNAGSPDKLNASDAKNGGMPGTVLDKINSPQWAEHRVKALQLADGKYVIPDELDNDPRFANVPYEARIAARTDSNVEVNQLMAQMKEERKAKEDAFRDELFKQLEFGPLEQASKTIDEAMAAGKLDKYDDLHRAVEIVKKREKDLEEQSVFLDRYNTNRPMDYTDPDNKKGMNKLFKNEAGETALSSRSGDYVDQVLIPRFKDKQMIAPDALGILEVMSQSNDGRNVLYSLATLSKLEETNPDAYAAQVKEGLRAKVDRYQTLNGNLDEKEMIDILRGPRTQEQRNAVAYRRDEIKKIMASPKSPVSFDSVSEAFAGAKVPDGIMGDAMRTEWQAILTEKYANGLALTPEEANAETLKEFSRIYGVTSIGGETIMRNPPDKVPSYPNFNEWGDAQIRGELALAEDEKPILISDRQTEAEINSGKLPSYQVFVERNGVVRQLFANPAPEPGIGYRGVDQLQRTEPLRFQFEYTQKHAEAQDAEVTMKNKEARLEKLREMTLPYPFGNAEGLFGKNVPQNLIEERTQLEAELNQTKAEVAAKKAAANDQYETPSMRRYKELDRQIQPILKELDKFTGMSEDFPRLTELEKLMDERDKLKTAIDAEAAVRRKKGAE